MTNQELVAKIEEWVNEHEEELLDDVGFDIITTMAVDSQSLILFIKKLLLE